MHKGNVDAVNTKPLQTIFDRSPDTGRGAWAFISSPFIGGIMVFAVLLSKPLGHDFTTGILGSEETNDSLRSDEISSSGASKGRMRHGGI